MTSCDRCSTTEPRGPDLSYSFYMTSSKEYLLLSLGLLFDLFYSFYSSTFSNFYSINMHYVCNKTKHNELYCKKQCSLRDDECLK